jgi:tRNA-splicing ligase RtcB (3'-phosphate/5'-hydroxy nucleic acid ligase)
MQIDKKIIEQVSPYLWQIPTTAKPNMKVPARIYATEKMLNDIFCDQTITQLTNVATLPGILKAALAMPDAHEGYGFPIGGVAAIKLPGGIISPGGIGYDINCGVRLLKSDLSFGEIKKHLENLSKCLYKWVPSGVGRVGQVRLSIKDLDCVLATGSTWTVKEEFGTQADLRHTESGGHLKVANPDKISVQAKERGRGQLGTLGAGNHFVEVDVVDEIYDEKIAAAFGLKKQQIVVQIHTGSRGLGHQVATDYIRTMVNTMGDYGIKLPDRELSGVPFSSQQGTNYFQAMSAAANFAWANRQIITWEVRNAWKEIFGTKEELTLLYDVAHNVAKIETHKIDGKNQEVLIHRKGATRAFPAKHPDLAAEFQETGQPVLIPGSMGTASYVLVGTESGMQETFGSCCHGAGRRMSRKSARRNINANQLKSDLKKTGIHIQTGSISGLSEEAPQAYKNIDDVIEVVHNAKIARRVARLRPCAVIKG